MSKVFNIDELRNAGLSEENIKALIDMGLAVEAMTPRQRTTKEKIADAKWACQSKAEKVWDGFKNGVSSTATWISENKAIAGTIAISLAGMYRTYANYKTHKMVDQRYQDSKLTIYDSKVRHHWPLRRPLTSDEFRELDIRVKNGESMYDVLAEFGVLR